MKLGFILLLTAIFLNGCQQLSNLTTPKPVEIDGLGSLSSIKDIKLNENQLLTVIKQVIKKKRVNRDDAQAMTEIYKQNDNQFLKASGRAIDSTDILSTKDVENYLALILQHESLRDDVNQTTQIIIIKEIKNSVNFDKPENSRIGENVGNLAGSYVNAYNRAIAKNSEEKRDALDNQQGINKVNIVNGFEQAAFEETDKTNAEQFLNDLKEYNDSLPAKSKILDYQRTLDQSLKDDGRAKGFVRRHFLRQDQHGR